MSTDRYTGIVIGIILGVVIVALCFVSYGAGRASIADQCLERRAFVYGPDAWGCVRLRRQHDVESGSYNQPENL